MEIDQNGPMTFTINQNTAAGSGIDVDFALWGPYNSLAAGCGGGTFPVGSPIDCSYSTAAVEDCDIINAVTGQFYILLITNYSNQNCNIDFSQTGGNGTTNCCIEGDAGLDNIVNFCESDPGFILESQLNGTPSVGGVWYVHRVGKIRRISSV